MTGRSHSTDVAVEIDAPIAAVWDELADISDHAVWMIDATSITFVGDQRTGVGTTFDCLTKVGPVKLVDRMTVIEWDPPNTIGVRHDGVVLGDGWFRLDAIDERRTRFRWSEEVRLRWCLGGALGWRASRPVMRRIWQRNLQRFARRFA